MPANIAMTWDNTGEKIWEAGVDRGVLFKMSGTTYGAGVAWNGLTTVSESPSGAEENASYADNIKYASIFSKEEFGCTIEAFQSPVEFDECDGMASPATGVTIAQQARKPFGFSYRTLIGSDVADAGDAGYIIHLVYGCKASPSEKSRETINESPEPTGFSWEVTTTPINVTGFKPTAHLQINSTLVDPDKLAAFEEILYGTGSTPARLPLPDEVFSLFS